MNLLFVTQSDSLKVFDAVASKIGELTEVNRVGFTLADSWAYHLWLKKHPDFEGRGHLLLKEWHVTARRHGKPDLEKLRRYEEMLGQPGLFGAIVCDRRLYMGPNCTFSQDYRRRFTDDQLLCMLEAGLEAVEKLFDELKPDLVVGFVFNTILDHLVYLFAKARGVHYYDIRPAKIGNRMFVDATANDPGPLLAGAYHELDEQRDEALFAEADTLIARARAPAAKYEGVVKASAAPAQGAAGLRRGLRGIVAFIRRWREFRASEAARDNHVPGLVKPLLYKALINPQRARLTDRWLRPGYVTPASLTGRRWAFFPLHTEPEVSLSVYSRPLTDQLPVVRAYALSLPADMLLVVKEHPWMVGKRSFASYRAYLNIPRVVFAAPELSARQLVEGCTMVTALTSSVAFEAAILGKPAMTVANAGFNLLPPTMLRNCRDLTRLQAEIPQFLATHAHDEAALRRYVAATLRASVGVNFYSGLLGRSGVHSDGTSGFERDIGVLANHLLDLARRPLPSGQGAASW
jgi:hypothetical protein